MVKLEQAVIMNQEAQSSDTALFRKDLPKAGKWSAIDVGIKITNGSTSAINLDPLDVIDRLSLVVNGSNYIYHLKGQDAFRHFWMKHGRPMPYTFTEAASGVQEVWFRMEFGRFMGDPQFGLDLARFSNVQVQIDYDSTNWGAVAATTFTTGGFTITLIAHQFPFDSQPAFQGMIGTREFWNGTSAASGDEVQSLPSDKPIIALSVSCLEDNVAEGTDVTDIKIGKDLFGKNWVDGKWTNFQQMQNAEIDVREEYVKLLLTTGASRDLHIANVKYAVAPPLDMTLAVA